MSYTDLVSHVHVLHMSYHISYSLSGLPGCICLPIPETNFNVWFVSGFGSQMNSLRGLPEEVGHIHVLKHLLFSMYLNPFNPGSKWVWLVV